MDNSSIGTCSHGQQRLLTKDYDESAIGFQTYGRRSRRTDICYIRIAAVSVLACIFACICAVYCYAALVEIQRLQDGKLTPIGPSEKLGREASTAPTSSAQKQYQYIFEGDDFDNDYEEYYESDEFDAGDADGDYDDADGDYDDGDISTEGSGESSERGSNVSNKKSLMRKRRATKPKFAKCIKKCNRKWNGNEKKRNRCIRRKCEKGGKTGDKKLPSKERNNVPSLVPAILPAAHFETAMNDKAIQDAVGIDHNEYSLTDGVPLDIFKPAEWVDETSPVTFINSVATANKAGIFLIYAQAYIGGKEPEKSIKIVQKRKSSEINSIACNNGMHVDHFDSYSSQLQTCSVLGLMKLEKGDTIEIQKSAANLEIILDKDKTYFGLVQLNSVAVQGMKKNKKSKN